MIPEGDMMHTHFFKNIQGWFDYSDLYSVAVRIAPSDRESHFVEIGTWLGRSAAFMAVEIANSGKSIRFDCVDSWEGTGLPGEYDAQKDVVQKGLFEQFRENLKPAEAFYTVERGMSHEVAQRYPDKSLDFVFLDAGHAYDAVSADLNAWLPKMKDGAIIAGHDFFTAPEGVGKAVRQLVPGFSTVGSWWYVKIGGGSTSEFEHLMARYRQENETLLQNLKRKLGLSRGGPMATSR